jgi:PAS domain S-box-containing protein
MLSKTVIEPMMNQCDAAVLGIDADSNIVFFNDAAQSILGVSREKMMDKNWCEMFLPKELRKTSTKEAFELKKDLILPFPLTAENSRMMM